MGCSPSRPNNVSDTEIVASKVLEYMCRSTEVKHSLGIMFEVKGFSDAAISLCGPQEQVEFEASIGAQGNSRCLLRSTTRENQDLSAQCESFGILDQTSYRGFWLTWRAGQLCLGKGYMAGQQALAIVPATRLDSHSTPSESYKPPGSTDTSDSGYRPYYIKVSCPTAGCRVCFRNPKLLFDGDI